MFLHEKLKTQNRTKRQKLREIENFVVLNFTAAQFILEKHSWHSYHFNGFQSNNDDKRHRNDQSPPTHPTQDITNYSARPISVQMSSDLLKRHKDKLLKLQTTHNATGLDKRTLRKKRLLCNILD